MEKLCQLKDVFIFSLFESPLAAGIWVPFQVVNITFCLTAARPGDGVPSSKLVSKAHLPPVDNMAAQNIGGMSFLIVTFHLLGLT